MGINEFLTDEIDIINVVTDGNGVLSKTILSGIKARVSEKNKLILNQSGKEVVSSGRIIISTGNTISYESKIKIKKICGTAYPKQNKEWQIQQLSRGHGFSNDFIEVWL